MMIIMPYMVCCSYEARIVFQIEAILWMLQQETSERFLLAVQDVITGICKLFLSLRIHDNLMFD